MAEVAPMDAALHAKIMRAWHGEDEVSSMTLPASGQIDMGQIRTEVGGSGQVSLNDADFRALINKSSGQQQALSDYYGKSSAPPEIMIWQNGASTASCAGIRRGQTVGAGHEQYTGYMTNGGSSQLSVNYSSGYPEGVHIWGNTQYAYSKWNGDSSEYPGGNVAYYEGRFDENGSYGGGGSRFPITLPSSWNGTPLDATNYGLQFKWQIYNINKVLGYDWYWETKGPGGGTQVSTFEINQNGWTTMTINAKDAKPGYYEGKGGNTYARNYYRMVLIHIKMVPEKENSYTAAHGQSRLEEILTAEEYRRYLVWLGVDPDEPEPEPAMTPEEWLAANPGQELADPDAEPVVPERSPEA